MCLSRGVAGEGDCVAVGVLGPLSLGAEVGVGCELMSGGGGGGWARNMGKCGG